MIIAEHTKRLKKIKKIFNYFDPSVFEGIILVGSMAYGEGYALRKDSDVDLLFFVRRNNLYKIYNFDFFRGPFVGGKAKKLFYQGKIFGLWDDCLIDGIKFNNGIISYEYFEKYCRFNTPETLKTYFDRKNDPTSGKIVKIEGQFRENIVITSFLINKILFDKNGSIKKNLKSLLRLTIKKYSTSQIKKKIEFILLKLESNQRSKIIRELYSG